MPRITVDGTELEVAEGRTILQALDDLGLLMSQIDVPHYCWHPKLSIDGSCRLCQVEVEGIPKLQIACNTRVQDGMVIRTDTDRVKQAREGVMELLLINHPLDCPICDQAGECKLQDYAFQYGVPHARTREPRRAAKKRVELGPTIVFDQERCILCRRCVRFCRQIPKTGELGVFARGSHSLLDTFPGTQLDNPYSMNVADICPVGALTTKDFRFKIRVWFLEDVPGVCTGCANGCNVHLGVANNKVYRYVPRRNDAVNETWICDEGRLSYKTIGAPDRLTQVLVQGAEGRLAAASFDAAVAESARLVSRLIEAHGPRSLAALASPHATNEDLYVLRRFLGALGAESAGFAVVEGHADTLLIKAEKAANASGARALGFGAAAPVLERVRRGEVRGLLVMGHDILGASPGPTLDALDSLDTVILLDTHRSALEQLAHVIFPVRHASEKHGTLTNFAGRVQRVWPAVEPPFEAHADGEVIWRVAAQLGLAGFGGAYDVRALSRALAEEDSAFAGITLDSVGEAGLPLRSVPGDGSRTGA